MRACGTPSVHACNLSRRGCCCVWPHPGPTLHERQPPPPVGLQRLTYPRTAKHGRSGLARVPFSVVRFSACGSSGTAPTWGLTPGRGGGDSGTSRAWPAHAQRSKARAPCRGPLAKRSAVHCSGSNGPKGCLGPAAAPAAGGQRWARATPGELHLGASAPPAHTPPRPDA